jgi:hypothetical protein
MRTVSFIAAAVLCSVAAGCNFVPRIVTGSGHESHEVRDVATFDSVSVSHSIEAKISLAPDQAQKVEVSGDDNIVPMVRTRVSGGKLTLDLPGTLGFHPKIPLVVTISATALTGLEAKDSALAHANRIEGGSVSVTSSDSAELTADIVTGDRVSITATDSSVLTAGEISAPDGVTLSSEDSSVIEAHEISTEGEVSVKAQDSSVVMLDGSAPALTADLSDSSVLDALDLTAFEAVISASSSSTAEVCATGSVHASLSDSSAVKYTCDPEKVTKDLDDSSTLDEK